MSHIQIIFVTHTWGVLYSGCQGHYEAWFVPEKVKCLHLRRKIPAIQVTEQHPGRLLGLVVRGVDLLLCSLD